MERGHRSYRVEGAAGHNLAAVVGGSLAAAGYTLAEAVDRIPVEVVDHNLVDGSVHSPAEEAVDHSPAEEAVDHIPAAVVADRMRRVRHTAQAAGLHTALAVHRGGPLAHLEYRMKNR